MNETAKTILTALDKALAKTPPPDPSPLTSAVATELGRLTPMAVGGPGTAWTKPNFPDGLHQDGRMVEFTAQTVWAVCMHSPTPLCPQDVLEKLGVLQQRMEKLSSEMDKYSLSNVQTYLHEQRDRLEEAALAGNVPEGIALSSREAVTQDFLAKQSAMNKVLVKITHEEVVPLAKPILIGFQKAAVDFLRNCEEGERESCKSFGIEYKPSVIWKAVVSMAMRYTPETRLPKPHAWRTPKSILDFLIEF